MKTRIVQEKIEIGKLFEKLGIEDKECTNYTPGFNLKVKSDAGFNEVKLLFRTEVQKAYTCYFGNNKTLKCFKVYLVLSQSCHILWVGERYSQIINLNY